VLESSLYGCSLSPAYSSELLYDWRLTANLFVSASGPLRPTTNNFIFKLNTCCYSRYVTSSMTRGWSCRLQLLLVLASAVILRLESSGTHDHILVSQIRDSPNLEGQVPVFISPRMKIARLYPQAPNRKRRFRQYLYCCMRVRYHRNVFTEPLPRKCSIRYNTYF
jgi:hypothetical protein